MWDLPHAQASLLFQLRMGHVPLQKHLYRIGKVSFPMCPACWMQDESVLHYLLMCPVYRVQRGKMEWSLLQAARSVAHYWQTPSIHTPVLVYQHHAVLLSFSWWLLQVSALHYSARDQVTKGFQTVASAHALHQPTIVGPSISRIVIHKFGT